MIAEGLDDKELLTLLLTQCENGWFSVQNIPIHAGVQMLNHFDVHPETLGHAFDQLMTVDELVFMILNDLNIDRVAEKLEISFFDDVHMPKAWDEHSTTTNH